MNVCSSFELAYAFCQYCGFHLQNKIVVVVGIVVVVVTLYLNALTLLDGWFGDHEKLTS